MPETDPDHTRQLTVIPAGKTPRIPTTVAASIVVPAIVADAGDRAARRFLEFFAATIRNKNTRTAYLHAVGKFFAASIRNKNTRMAYLHAVGKFFAWCERHRVGQLADIEPLCGFR